jgi:hypothetical protein
VVFVTNKEARRPSRVTVTRRMSQIARHMSHVTIYNSPVIRQASRVTRNTSSVTRRMFDSQTRKTKAGGSEMASSFPHHIAAGIYSGSCHASDMAYSPDCGKTGREPCRNQMKGSTDRRPQRPFWNTTFSVFPGFPRGHHQAWTSSALGPRHPPRRCLSRT